MLPIETLYVEDYDIRYTTTIGDDKTTTYTWLRYNQQSMQLEEITADKLPDKK